jgi:hypothetical protein
MENVVGVRLLCRNGMEKSSEKETGESDSLDRNLIPRESKILISFIALPFEPAEGVNSGVRKQQGRPSDCDQKSIKS